MPEKQKRCHVWVPRLLIVSVFFTLCLAYRNPEINSVPFNPSDSRVYFSVPSFDSTNDPEHRKSQFFTFLRPVIESENRRIEKIRQSLITLFSKVNEDQDLSGQNELWLTAMARKYGIRNFNPHDPALQEKLLRRVDTVPPSLALAQAANESAWGTSRFARKGNNLFGQWTHKKGSGIIPKQRDTDKTHEVSRFISVNASVRSYIHNLNTHKSYKKFRTLRQTMRQDGIDPTGLALAEGLLHYSSQGRKYIKSIRSIIRNNKKLMNI